MGKPATTHAHRPTTSLLTTQGRESRPFRVRVGASFAVVGLLHIAGLALMLIGIAGGGAAGLIVGAAGFAYARGLIHSFDFDHVSMIDNSTRKFVAEGRRPASVGLAFSAGHSTVVIITSVLVIAGFGAIRSAFEDGTGPARVLGIIGLSISGLYLLLVAIANLATFLQAWRLRRQLRQDPSLEIPVSALTPRGPAARIMTAPLRRVRHPRHIYVIGFLFSLGFDTSSQIGLLVVAGSAALAGAPLISLLSLPLLFTAAMTLGDTCNGLMMLRMYTAAQENPAHKITYNLVVTGVGIVSALVVGVLAISGLLVDEIGWTVPPLAWLTGLDTSYAGYLLAGLFAVIGAIAWLIWRRRAADAQRLNL